MAKEPASALDASLTTEQAASLIGVTDRYIRQLMQDGRFKRDANGVLTVFAVVRGYIEAKDQEIEQARLKAADNEVRRAKAKEINLRIAEKERELVPRDEVEALVQLVVGEIVSRLQGLPARFTRDINERRRLEQLVYDIRGEVADLTAKYGETFRTGGELIDATDEDDAGPMGEEA